VGSYTGCCPSDHSSGGVQRFGHIDRHGNSNVRILLVEAVWRLLRWQPGWHARLKYLQKLKHGASLKKKMAVALARQLANDLWRWSPATETWTQLANMPTGKQNIQGAYWNGKIYVPGGFTTVHLTENAIYDIATNTWSLGAPLPAMQSGTNVAFSNKI
jgi:hypothetical protein